MLRHTLPYLIFWLMGLEDIRSTGGRTSMLLVRREGQQQDVLLYHKNVHGNAKDLTACDSSAVH